MSNQQNYGYYGPAPSANYADGGAAANQYGQGPQAHRWVAAGKPPLPPGPSPPLNAPVPDHLVQLRDSSQLVQERMRIAEGLGNRSPSIPGFGAVAPVNPAVPGGGAWGSPPESGEAVPRQDAGGGAEQHAGWAPQAPHAVAGAGDEQQAVWEPQVQEPAVQRGRSMSRSRSVTPAHSSAYPQQANAETNPLPQRREPSLPSTNSRRERRRARALSAGARRLSTDVDAEHPHAGGWSPSGGAVGAPQGAPLPIFGSAAAPIDETASRPPAASMSLPLPTFRQPSGQAGPSTLGAVAVAGKVAGSAMIKAFEKLKKTLAGTYTCPFFGGPAAGELSIANSATLFYRRFENTLRYSEFGHIGLEEDRLVGGSWETIPDEYTPSRIAMLHACMQEHLQTPQQIVSSNSVMVYSVVGDISYKERSQLTCKDFLRLLVREQANTAGATEYAQAALDEVRLGPNEAWAAAALRVRTGYIATQIDAENPAGCEFFWELVTERQYKALIDATLEAFCESPAHLLTFQSIRLEKSHQAVSLLRQYRLERHDPKGEMMQRRGRAAEQFYNELVSLISSRSATDSVVLQTTPKPSAKRARTVGPDSMFAAVAAPRKLRFKDLRRMSTGAQLPLAALAGPSPGHAPAAGPVSTDVLAALAQPSYDADDEVQDDAFGEEVAGVPELAAFRNQVATPPGQHGVPFESSRRSTSSRGREAPPAAAPRTAAAPAVASSAVKPERPALRRAAAAPTATIPPPTAPRTEIRAFLQRKGFCFDHALRGTCGREHCRFNHEPLAAGHFRDAFPAGIFRDAPRQQGGQPSRQRHVLAALMPEDFDEACKQGLILQEGPPSVSAEVAGESVGSDSC